MTSMDVQPSDYIKEKIAVTTLLDGKAEHRRERRVEWCVDSLQKIDLGNDLQI